MFIIRDGIARGAILLVLIFMSGGKIFAQQSVASATFSGVTEDANGAVLGGTVLTITNLEQNQTRTAMSDAQGRFRFLYLPVGNYQFKAEHAGFAVVERQLTLT
ncbi:MAG TPA: carboxypeptidase-like regulatory domain-containing protein, partial [Blastocatellia bacterium]|nr:carboxypeptidase-like regulatory domain-containing protein [Blastocatellia bacterium]